MSKASEYNTKINAYFDNEMSGEAETAFMQEVDDNAALRKKFEEELEMRAIFRSLSEAGTDEKAAARQVVMAGAAAKKKGAPVILMYPRFKMLAAAVVVAVVAVSVVFVVVKNQNSTRPVAATPTKEGTHKKIDSIKNSPAPDNHLTASTLAKFFPPYTSQNDPAGVSLYYQQLQKGNYAEILSAKKEDVQTMGADDDNDRLVQYLQLYKGLAYLAKNDASSAVKHFEAVLGSASPATPQYYTAQWYSVLADVKLGLVNDASSNAVLIAKSGSPYKTNAGELVKYLSGK